MSARTTIISLAALAILAACSDTTPPTSSGEEHAHAGHEHGDDEHGDDEHGDDEHGDDEHDDDEHGDDEHGGDEHGDDEHDDDEHDDDEHGDDEHGDESPVVRLTEVALTRAGIQTAVVESGALGAALTVPAEVQLNPDRMAHISPLVDGQLIEVTATVGDDVEVGQALASLRSVALGQARAELRRARALQDAAEQNLERQRRLREEGIASERSLLEAQLAYDEASAERDAASSHLSVFGVRGGAGADMDLESPIAGRVIERHATRGEAVSPSDTLFVVADLSRVWVVGRVYDQQLARLHAGMPATLELDAYPGRQWTGVVDYVGDRLDESTRTLPVRVELDNADGLLRPGLFGRLSLAEESGAGASTLVPRAAVQTVDGADVVFVPGPEPGTFVPVEVTLGGSAGDRVEVIAGLHPGDSIVVAGAFVLKSELMRSELGHGHAH